MALIFWYVVSLFAVYRLTYLVTQEDGPFDMFVTLQAKLEGVPLLGKLIGCFYCLSFWVALPAVFWLSQKYELAIVEMLMASLGISGMCVWLFDANTRGE